MILITICTILLLSVTGTTVYWTIAYRSGYDSSWFPWPPQTPKQLLSVGIFTYKYSQNGQNISGINAGFGGLGGANSFGGNGKDIDDNYNLTTTTEMSTTIEQLATQINNGSSPTGLTDELRFNLHPTLMTVGFVTLTGFCK